VLITNSPVVVSNQAGLLGSPAAVTLMRIDSPLSASAVARLNVTSCARLSFPAATSVNEAGVGFVPATDVTGPVASTGLLCPFTLAIALSATILWFAPSSTRSPSCGPHSPGAPVGCTIPSIGVGQVSMTTIEPHSPVANTLPFGSTPGGNSWATLTPIVCSGVSELKRFTMSRAEVMLLPC